MTIHSPAALVKSKDAYLAFRATESSAPVGPVEVEPFVFDGQLWTVAGIAPSGAYSGKIRIDGPLQRPFATIDAPDFEYVSAHVEDGFVFLYGTSTDRKRISMMWSSDLLHWSAPVVVFTAPTGQGYYNTSVARDPFSGTYRMVVETHHDTGYPANWFIIHVLAGTNPSTWTMTPHIFMNSSYVNCPTIRYVGGVLYMLFMEWTGTHHVTFVARSLDHGATWARGLGADGETAAFVPASGEANNNSDVALVEYQGQTFFTYGRGDQTSWLDCVTATYPGTMKQYFESFFPSSPPPPPPPTGNQIPVMTGETTANVRITASDYLLTTPFLAWKVGDRDPAMCWHCEPGAYPHTLIVEFLDVPRPITSLKIKPRTGFPAQAPKAFSVVSVTGGVRTTVGSFTNQTYTDGAFKSFTLTPSTASRFEIVMNSNVAGDVYLSVGEIEMVS
jgi:hypothetical protein